MLYYNSVHVLSFNVETRKSFMWLLLNACGIEEERNHIPKCGSQTTFIC